MTELERETAGVLRALRERDESTFAHCDRTCALSVETGKACGLSAAELVTLRMAAELHDVGKIGIPDRILFKPGRLTEEERRVMRTHSRRGYDILTSIPDEQIAAVASIVLRHHEAIDGNGYPDGLKGDEIPVLARILSIVDSYDALATVRPYHAQRSHAQIMRLLHDEEGRKYDPSVLACFARIVENSQYRAVGSGGPIGPRGGRQREIVATNSPSIAVASGEDGSL